MFFSVASIRGHPATIGGCRLFSEGEAPSDEPGFSRDVSGGHGNAFSVDCEICAIRRGFDEPSKTVAAPARSLSEKTFEQPTLSDKLPWDIPL
jgi:hypothetical protein